MPRVIQLVLVLGVLAPVTLLAQQPASPSPAAVAGLTVSPKWGQGPEQQRQSEEECYGRARGDTGVDPAAFSVPDSTPADTFVAGSAVYSADDPDAMVRSLRDAATAAVR